MVVAVRGGHRQAVHHQFDAVAVEVHRVQVRAPAGIEGGVAGGAVGRPHAGHITQHVADADHIALRQVFGLHQAHTPGRQNLLPHQFAFGIRHRVGALALHGDRVQQMDVGVLGEGAQGQQDAQADGEWLAFEGVHSGVPAREMTARYKGVSAMLWARKCIERVAAPECGIMSQGRLGKELGVSKTSVSSWKLGSNSPEFQLSAGAEAGFGCVSGLSCRPPRRTAAHRDLVSGGSPANPRKHR